MTLLGKYNSYTRIDPCLAESITCIRFCLPSSLGLLIFARFTFSHARGFCLLERCTWKQNLYATILPGNKPGSKAWICCSISGWSCRRLAMNCCAHSGCSVTSLSTNSRELLTHALNYLPVIVQKRLQNFWSRRYVKLFWHWQTMQTYTSTYFLLFYLKLLPILNSLNFYAPILSFKNQLLFWLQFQTLK